MPTTSTVTDVNGAVMFWGPVQRSIRSLPARQALWARPVSAEPFGDMNGPLGYWGPVAERDTLPAALVA
jgi:hypothetical protein